MSEESDKVWLKYSGKRERPPSDKQKAYCEGSSTGRQCDSTLQDHMPFHRTQQPRKGSSFNVRTHRMTSLRIRQKEQLGIVVHMVPQKAEGERGRKKT